MRLVTDNAEEEERPKDETSRRLFFAVNLPKAVTTRLDNMVASFGVPSGQVRWVKSENMHITLKFLGDVDNAMLPDLCAAAKRAVKGFSPIRLSVEGMGVFPNHERPRVIWFGVGGETAGLKKLEESFSAEISPLGFPPDERSFTAHLTIGRVKNDAARGKLARLVRQYHKFYIGEALVGDVSLYESRLNPKGSIHTVVETFPLESPGGT
ncbi:MAG: RNA 2',3'-cyclic phosphodiesterase [Nitrospinae bacterium]|nr:RNA 2',3'-cyclic phosphodiesterase [Nitrospinota bacterium]